MNDKSLYSDFLGKFIRISLLFLGFLYVCGLFISHFHLRRLGIHEFSPFQIQYILTGFTFVLILVAPILVLIVILTIAGKKAPFISKILELSLVIILAGITMIYMILFFFYGDFEWSWIFARSGKIIKFGGIYWLLYGWLVYATGKSLIDDLVRIRRG